MQAPVLNGNVDSTGLWWSEKASEDYPWAIVLRTFYTQDAKTYETIGRFNIWTNILTFHYGNAVFTVVNWVTSVETV